MGSGIEDLHPPSPPDTLHILTWSMEKLHGSPKLPHKVDIHSSSPRDPCLH